MNEYTKQDWVDYPDTITPLSSERLNYIESGISANSDNCVKLNDEIQALEEKVQTLQSLIWKNDSGETMINSTNGAYLKLDDSNTATIVADDTYTATEDTSS